MKVNVRIPKLGARDDSLGHLRALFPTLDLNALHALLTKFVETGRAHRPRKKDFREIVRMEATDGAKYHRRLREIQWQVLKRVAEVTEDAPWAGQSASLAEVMTILGYPGNSVSNADKALLSAALDRAIDEADLVPDTSVMPFGDGIDRVVRGFRIDGELILSDVNRLQAIWRRDAPPPHSRKACPSWT